MPQIGPTGATSATSAALAGAVFTGSVEFKGSQPWYDPIAWGADPTGAADSTTAINAMIAAINAAGPRGATIRWSGYFQVTAALTAIDVPVVILGSGTHNNSSTRAQALLYVSTAAVGGLSFTVNAAGSLIDNLYVHGSAAIAGTDNGITALCRMRYRNVVVDGFGQDGFNHDTTASAGNCNGSSFQSTTSVNNKRHGYYLTGTDSNTTVLTGTSAKSNGGWGYYNGTGTRHNTFIGVHSDSNTSGPIYDNGTSNHYYNPYDEHAAACNLDTAATYSVWFIGANSDSPTVTNLNGEGTNNHYIVRGGKLQTGPFSIVGPRFLGTGTGTVTIGSANSVRYFRVVEGGTISKIRVSIGVSSGNICVSVHSNTGTGLAAKPGAMVASSGSVASPGTGVQDIALGSSVLVQPGDWLGIGADNATVTFSGFNGSGDSTVTGGQVCVQATFPAVTTPTTSYGNNRMIEVVGVP